MAAPRSPGATEPIVRRELRVIEAEDRIPRDACLVLFDRSGSADFASAARSAAEDTESRSAS